MSIQRILLISAAAVCAISSAWAQTTITPASITRNYLFPPVGLGSSETASITVVNTAAAVSPVATSTTNSPSPSCTGTISFSNLTTTIGTPATFSLGPEGFKTVTLPFSSAGLSGNRGEIQGKVSLTISTSNLAICSLMFSLETYDSNTGDTHAVLSASLVNEVPVGPILPLLAPGIR